MTLAEDHLAGLPEAAVDNDVLIKAACYGLAAALGEGRLLGVLGAARYVVTGRIATMRLAGDRAGARDAALKLLDRSVVLEPTEEELRLAVGIETAAQLRGVSLDAGESQLAAMVITRSIPVLETGDKRAIRGFEALLDELVELTDLSGRVRCIEQIVLRCACDGDSQTLAQAICSEPHVDKALSICFRCFSPSPHWSTLDLAGLVSYVDALRTDAPRVLEPRSRV
jgi:hypothetical protein